MLGNIDSEGRLEDGGDLFGPGDATAEAKAKLSGLSHLLNIEDTLNPSGNNDKPTGLATYVTLFGYVVQFSCHTNFEGRHF